MKPTVILVHGAFAESSSWDSVVDALDAHEYHVVSAANPLRGVAHDAAYVSSLIRSITGPIVLVGHSYGGAVISNVDRSAGEIRALVYVAAFAPDEGETCALLSSKVPGGTLGETLNIVDLPDGGHDWYISQDRYHQQFCADLPAAVALRMAVSQRPCTEASLTEPAGSDPLWKDIPSWFIYGELDRNIPAGAHAFMAQRANAERAAEIAGASHVVGMSHPDETVHTILEAAAATELVDA